MYINVRSPWCTRYSKAVFAPRHTSGDFPVVPETWLTTWNLLRRISLACSTLSTQDYTLEMVVDQVFGWPSSWTPWGRTGTPCLLSCRKGSLLVFIRRPATGMQLPARRGRGSPWCLAWSLVYKPGQNILYWEPPLECTEGPLERMVGLVKKGCWRVHMGQFECPPAAPFLAQPTAWIHACATTTQLGKGIGYPGPCSSHLEIRLLDLFVCSSVLALLLIDSNFPNTCVYTTFSTLHASFCIYLGNYRDVQASAWASLVSSSSQFGAPEAITTTDQQGYRSVSMAMDVKVQLLTSAGTGSKGSASSAASGGSTPADAGDEAQSHARKSGSKKGKGPGPAKRVATGKRVFQPYKLLGLCMRVHCPLTMYAPAAM